MIAKLYEILPSFFKKILIYSHKETRKILYILKNIIVFWKKPVPLEIYNYNLNRKYGPLKKVCYAPYTSMFFSRMGYVSACYASYNENSSHISQESLKQIWYKGSIHKIRQQHKDYNFENCKFCKSLIDNKAYGNLLINKYEHYAFSLSEYPRIMEFELSNKCNLSCIMCDANLSSMIEKSTLNNISGNQFYGENFFEELKEFIPHLQLAEFTGGDPLIIDEYYRIFELLKDLNPKCNILITTNANTYNTRVQWLLDNFDNVNFNVSIDSLNPEIYPKIRRNGNFSKAMENLTRFISYTQNHNNSLNILVCPMTINFNEMPDFVNFANEKNICVYYHTVVKPKELSLKYNTNKQIIELINKFKKLSFPEKTLKQKINYNNFKDLIKLVEIWQNELHENQNNYAEIKVSYTEKEIENILFQKLNGYDDLLKIKLQSVLNKINDRKDYNLILNKLLHVEKNNFIKNLEENNDEALLNIINDMMK